MKVRLLVDCIGKNPAHKPPDPNVDRAAWMTYKYRVPHDITLPAGTIIDDPWAWVQCMPAAGMRAEPVDEEAILMVQGETQTLDPKVRRTFEAVLARREQERLLKEKAAQPKPKETKTDE